MTTIHPQRDDNKKGKPIQENYSHMIDTTYETLIVNLHQVYLLDEVFVSRKEAMQRYQNLDYRTRNRFSHKHQFVIQRTILEQKDSSWKIWLRAIPNPDLRYGSQSQNQPYPVLETLNTAPYGKQTKKIDWTYPLPVKLLSYKKQSTSSEIIEKFNTENNIFAIGIAYTKHINKFEDKLNQILDELNY